VFTRNSVQVPTSHRRKSHGPGVPDLAFAIGNGIHWQTTPLQAGKKKQQVCKSSSVHTKSIKKSPPQELLAFTLDPDDEPTLPAASVSECAGAMGRTLKPKVKKKGWDQTRTCQISNHTFSDLDHSFTSHLPHADAHRALQVIASDLERVETQHPHRPEQRETTATTLEGQTIPVEGRRLRPSCTTTPPQTAVPSSISIWRY